MQKGVFTISPDSGQNDGSISASAPKYTGREAPSDLVFRLRKVGGGLETRRLTVKQPAYPEFFKIESITKRDLPDGSTELTINCRGNVLLSSVTCAAQDFYGIVPTSGKSWQVFINGAKVSEFTPALRNDGYGVNISNYTGSEAFGKVSEYTMTAYLTVPANTDTLAKEYDFYFGVPVWGDNQIPRVGQYPTNSALDTASHVFGKIVINGSGEGTITISPTTLYFGSSDTAESNVKSVRVNASGTWEVVASSVPSWLEVRTPSSGNSFLVVPVSSNTSTDNRTANITVQLTNGSKSTSCQVTQNGVVGESIYMHLNGKNYVEYKSLPSGMGQTLSISASGPFTLSGFPDWITEGTHTGTTSGDYDEVVSINISALESRTEEREATIVATLTGSGLSSSVTIHQRPTDDIQITDSSEGTLVSTSSAAFGGAWSLTVDAGGTEKTLTFGVDANCLWRPVSTGDYETVTTDSSSITVRLTRSSAANSTTHLIGLQGAHNDIVGYNASVLVTWPGA